MALLFSGAIFLFSNSASAHHSFAATFDINRNITIEGVISEFQFENPHVMIYLQVQNPDGSTTRWMSQGDAATRFRHAGWTADTVRISDHVRVIGNAAHGDLPAIWINQIELLDPATGEVVRQLNPHGYPEISDE